MRAANWLQQKGLPTMRPRIEQGNCGKDIQGQSHEAERTEMTADRIAELESMLESQCAAYIVCDRLRENEKARSRTLVNAAVIATERAEKAEGALAAAPTERLCTCGYHQDVAMTAHTETCGLYKAPTERRVVQQRKSFDPDTKYARRRAIYDRRTAAPNTDPATLKAIDYCKTHTPPAAPEPFVDPFQDAIDNFAQREAQARQARGEGEPGDAILAHPESNAAPDPSPYSITGAQHFNMENTQVVTKPSKLTKYTEPWTAETIYDVSEKVWTAGINWSTWGHKVQIHGNTQEEVESMRDEILKLYLPVASSKSTLPLSTKAIEFRLAWINERIKKDTEANIRDGVMHGYRDALNQALRAIELERVQNHLIAKGRKLERENAELKARMK